MTVLVSDSFNRTNSTTTLGTTDSYNGGTAKTWSVEFSGSRTFGIDSNQAYQVTTNSDARAYVDAGVSDCIVKETISTYSAGVGLVFRYSSDSDYMEVITTSTAYVVRRFNLDEGTVNMISYTTTPASGDTVAIKLDGNSIELILNNVSVGTTTSTRDSTNTKHGIRFNGNAARIDSFQIDSLSVSPTTYNGSGTSSGTSTTSATPILRKQASGTASGTSTTSAVPILRKQASGLANGTSSTSATIGAVTLQGSGASSGTSDTSAAPILRRQASGTAAGTSSASASPVLRQQASGVSNGISWTSVNLGGNSNDLYYYRKNKVKGLLV